MIDNYVTLPRQTVLSINKVGDYDVIGQEAKNEMGAFLECTGKLGEAKFYSISYDDPRERPNNCRFEFYAVISGVLPQGGIQEKQLDGGRFALFHHKGSVADLKNFIYGIFANWHVTNPNDAIVGTIRLQHKSLYSEAVSKEELETDILVPVKEATSV